MPIRIVSPASDVKSPSTAEDVLRSSVTGQAEGWSGLFGTVGDIRDLAEKGVGAALGAMGSKERPKMRPSLPVDVLSRSAAILAERAGIDPALAKFGTALAVPGALFTAPNSKEMLAAVTRGKPTYKPQTKAGEYARTINQFAPAALSPGTPVQRVANVVVPAVTSETAGQFTKGTELEPYARVGAALAGAGGVALATRGAPDTRLLAEASRGATDDQVRAATALMQEAQGRGVRLTMAEALQQVTNGSTGMGRMQRVIEGTRGGSERLGPMMSDRPRQVAGAVSDFADNIAPAAPDPYVLGQQAQGAADDVLNGVRQQINANARPWYEALQTERMPPTPAWEQVQRSAEYQTALSAIRGDPILNQPLASLPDDSLAVVDKVVQQLDTLANNARPNPASATGNAQLSAAFDGVRRQVDDLASAYSEPWRLSRSMVASGREAFLEPLQAGPMGAISRAPSTGSQTAALYPNAPLEGAAPITGQTLEMLPPEISGGLTRQHLMTTFNEAAQQNIPGENQWGGAKWAAQVAGNPEQQRVLQTGVEASGGNRGDLDALIEVLRATGRRERPGSMTAYNARDLEELGKAGTTGEILKGVASGPSLFRRIGEGLQNWQTERNAGRLAEAIMASPQEAEQILLRARAVVPPGAQLDAIERLALAARQSTAPRLEAR